MTQPKYNASWTCHMYTEASQSPWGKRSIH
jgi:hypothetical protein